MSLADFPEIRVLKQLYFPSFYSREQQIRDANEDTFTWIFVQDEVHVPDDPKQKSGNPHNPEEALQVTFNRERHYRSKVRRQLLHWLRNENGIFHITGKIRSRKSTSMKFLIREPQTLEELSK